MVRGELLLNLIKLSSHAFFFQNFFAVKFFFHAATNCEPQRGAALYLFLGLITIAIFIHGLGYSLKFGLWLAAFCFHSPLFHYNFYPWLRVFSQVPWTTSSDVTLFCVKKFELFISWWWWVVAFVMVYGVKWLVRYVEESKVWFWTLFYVSWALSVLHTFLGIFFFNQKLSPQSRRQTMEWIEWSKRNNPQCIYMSVIALN